jgi:surface carbohydrate biosynthesis protein
MNIYIPIEVKVRELEGRTLLALAAAERGHRVLIGSKSDTLVPAFQGKLPPGIVHMKSLTPSEQMIDQLQQLKNKGFLVTSQDEESGLLDESYEKFANIRYGHDSLALADAVFGWGEFDVACLRKTYPSDASKMIPTGSPRVDFWRTDFQDYFQLDEKLIKWQDKPYLLVVSNFGSVIRSNKIWNVMARLREAGYFDRDPEMELFEYEYSGYMLQLIGHFVKMIRALAEAYPDVQILIRPHPVEAEDAWDKMIGPYPNVHVFRDGTISAWIRGARAIIHNGCTSALEAAVSGVPRIAYRPLPSPFEREIPNQLSREAFSIEEMIERVGHILDGSSSRTELKQDSESHHKLMQRLVNVDGVLAADRIVNEWDRLGNDTKWPTSRVLTKESLHPTQEVSGSLGIGKSVMSKLYSIARSVVSSAESTAVNGNTELLDNSFKFKSFTDEEMTSIKDNLTHTLNRFKDVRVERVSDRAFLLSKD